jgi:hypothetical protein
MNISKRALQRVQEVSSVDFPDSSTGRQRKYNERPTNGEKCDEEVSRRK